MSSALGAPPTWRVGLVATLAAAMAGCWLFPGNEAPTEPEVNVPPSAWIDQPTLQDRFNEGDPVTLRGGGRDDEDGSLGGSSLVWTCDWMSGTIGVGGSVTLNNVPPGLNTVTLTVTDSDGASATATRTFPVWPEEYGGENQPPTATITTPAELSVYPVGDPLVLEGTGHDPEEGALTGDALIWEVGGAVWTEVGRGDRLVVTGLESGRHFYRLKAEDPYGAWDFADTGPILVYTERSCALQTLVVEPSPITVAPGTSGAAAVTIDPGAEGRIQLRLEGDVDDVSDVITAWEFSPALSQGSAGATRTLTFTARPDVVVGQTFELQIRVYFYDVDEGTACGIPVQVEIVEAGNTAPVVTITSPVDRGQYSADRPLRFLGTAVDAEDGELSGPSLVWESDVDGVIGTGNTFERSDLSLGTHEIQLTATDAKGAEGSTSIVIEVAYATICDNFFLSLTPTAIEAKTTGLGPEVTIQLTRVPAFTRDVTLSLLSAKPIWEVLRLYSFRPKVLAGAETLSTLSLSLAVGLTPGQTFDFTVIGESTSPASMCYGVFSLTIVDP